ncbi:MAG: ABC transporter ATP-binding protein [Oscillospiraceae bacterium]|nr:ABC transporter ATP-binding protein [Oscillospiraceae bacterium]
MEKHNSTSTIKWLWQVTGKQKLYVALLMILNGAYGGSGVLYALLLRNIVDSATEKDSSGFFRNVLLIVSLVAAQITVYGLIYRLDELCRAGMENRFKKRLFHSILTRDFGAVSAVHSGEWLNRLTNDCQLVATNFTDILPGVFGMAIKLLSAAVMLIVLDRRFAAILLPVGIAVLLVTHFCRKPLKRLHRRIQEADGRLRIFLQERLGSLMMLRTFAAEEQTEAYAADKMAAHKTARMKKNNFSVMTNVGFQIGMQGMYLIGVCYCGYGILHGLISFGTLTAVTQLITQIRAPFSNITGYLPKYYATMASAERMIEVESFEPDCENETKSLDEILTCYRGELEAIGLRHVDFTYYAATDTVTEQSKADMPLVLRNISLEVRKGEYAAFTGQSGCGKSTVLKLLMCVYKPDTGERYVSCRSGEQLLDGAWHRLFAYVPQGNQLMRGTIREIVAFADPDAMNDDDRIQHALKIACADEFVNAMEQGADTVLGERGTGLSEGQMQRIAVARAIFSGSPVLVLDEATSALDEATERQLLDNLREMTDKTVLIVTHRPAALDICDRIFRFTPDGVTTV